jgi:hypothetical protein
MGVGPSGLEGPDAEVVQRKSGRQCREKNSWIKARRFTPGGFCWLLAIDLTRLQLLAVMIKPSLNGV